ncbi:hypothetical protein VTL71DRAFT_4665 [Oculimacula yallundae]|uniref:Uncharacterized protein n=1 Tax=Oculimacula yallundae TaxID=86028 RepID=A0ABR4C495_9HELO
MQITLSGTTTTYLPLSTAYPSQASCSSLFIAGVNNDDSKIFAFDPSLASHNSAPACLPPEATLWWKQNPSTDLTTRTELGGYKMICPEAYKTVAMSVLDQSSTMVGCCPSGYNFVSWATAPNPQQCNSPLPAGTLTYLQAVTEGTWTTTSTSLSEPSSIWGVQINGLLFAKPSPTGANIVTSTPLSSNTGFSGSDSDSTKHSSGLTRGAKIGIGIGSAIGFVVLCALFVLGVLFWRRKRGKMSTSPSQVAIGPEGEEEQEQKSGYRVRTEERTEEQLVEERRHVGMG